MCMTTALPLQCTLYSLYDAVSRSTADALLLMPLLQVDYFKLGGGSDPQLQAYLVMLIPC